MQGGVDSDADWRLDARTAAPLVDNGDCKTRDVKHILQSGRIDLGKQMQIRGYQRPLTTLYSSLTQHDFFRVSNRLVKDPRSIFPTMPTASTSSATICASSRGTV
jgi:hypothetical protein